jgi:Glycosyl hydrolases family 2, sugar binding domain.
MDSVKDNWIATGCGIRLGDVMHGSAVYHRNIKVDKSEGKRYFLELQGVGTYATLVVNGYRYPKELVGRTVFSEDITQQS